MNKELFSAMQRQLTPSPQARSELEERLTEASPKKRPAFRWQYGAAAACLLAVAAVPLWRHWNPDLHAVIEGQGNSTQAYQEDSAVTTEGTEALPRLNFWDTDPPSEGSANSYAAGEGVNREATQADLEALLGGSIPEALGWEGFDQLSGMLAFGPPKGEAESTQRPLDELFYGHFYASCDWGELTLMVGGPSITVSPDAIGRPEDYPGNAFTQIGSVEIRAARFTNPDGTAYGEVSFTMDSRYSIFYSVNSPSAAQTEELLARLVQTAVVENRLFPSALSPDPNTYIPPMDMGEATAPEPLAGLSGWQSQSWFGGCFYDNAAGRYVIVTVEGEAPPELAFGDAGFITGTYSYAHLSGLMDQLNQLAVTDPECGSVMAAWALNEPDNRIDLTITEESSHLLAILARLDPAGDAIQITLGDVPSTGVGDIATYDVFTEEAVGDGVSGCAQPGSSALREPLAVEPIAPGQSTPASPLPEQPVSDLDTSFSSEMCLPSQG